MSACPRRIGIGQTLGVPRENRKMMKKEFGFYPEPLKITAGPVTISPLPEFQEKVSHVLASDGKENDWVYAPPLSRIFGLPKTHLIEHTEATNEKQLNLHIWALSFFVGMRLTTEQRGFVDATPLKPGKLVDFVLVGSSLARALGLVDRFWKKSPQNAERFAAAVNVLFLTQNPQNLQFERFMYLYMAIDACFKMATSTRPLVPLPDTHKERIEWLCNKYQIVVPTWADPTVSNGPEVTKIRNDTFHEALYMGAPLGFAVHEGSGKTKNLMLEMTALVCRFLVALIGGDDNSYVRSSTNTRSIFGLDLS